MHRLAGGPGTAGVLPDRYSNDSFPGTCAVRFSPYERAKTRSHRIITPPWHIQLQLEDDSGTVELIRKKG